MGGASEVHAAIDADLSPLIASALDPSTAGRPLAGPDVRFSRTSTGSVRGIAKFRRTPPGATSVTFRQCFSGVRRCPALSGLGTGLRCGLPDEDPAPDGTVAPPAQFGDASPAQGGPLPPLSPPEQAAGWQLTHDP